MRAAGFDQDSQSIVAKILHERQAVGLEQRFASGELNDWQTDAANYASERFSEAQDLLAHVVEGQLASFAEGIGRIAIRATEIAGRQPHEDARQACKSAFALQAQVDFINDERLGHRRSIGLKYR